MWLCRRVCEEVLSSISAVQLHDGYLLKTDYFQMRLKKSCSSTIYIGKIFLTKHPYDSWKSNLISGSLLQKWMENKAKPTRKLSTLEWASRSCKVRDFLFNWYSQVAKQHVAWLSSECLLPTTSSALCLKNMFQRGKELPSS